MRLLLTNDDGVEAPGLASLAACLAGDGHDVLIVGPRRDHSGSGTAIGAVPFGTAIDVDRVVLGGTGGQEAFAMDVSPALCVLSVCRGTFGAIPDLVVAGINAGPNTGAGVVHSGTVAAPLIGSVFGLRGLAVSVDSGSSWHWDTAARFASVAVAWLAGASGQTVVNLNVPNVPPAEVRGLRVAQLARSTILTPRLEESPEGNLRMALEKGLPEEPPDTDRALLAAGYATVTGLTGIAAVPTDVAGLVSYMEGALRSVDRCSDPAGQREGPPGRTGGSPSSGART